MPVNTIAEKLCKKLVKEGFTVQRYDAYSTQSIYIKLDFGVCNSIRISNHPGKKYLKYRYNIGPHIKEFKTIRDKFPRFYYREDKIDNLVKKILQDRKEKVERYGMDAYQRFMEENRIKNYGKKGFWHCARLINEGGSMDE